MALSRQYEADYSQNEGRGVSRACHISDTGAAPPATA
jgi:hypothetical protein